jgi:hypothetical protein
MTFSSLPAGQTPDAGGAPYAWPLALAVSTVTGTLVTSCMMPFVAIAVMSAATLPLRSALLTVVAAWAANQLIGFTLLGYPADAYAIGWGVALGLASLAAMLVARAIVERQAWSIARIGAAFLVAFAVYEALLFGYASMAGGTETFAPGIVIQLLVNDSVWCAILAACYLVLTSLAPKIFGAAPSLRLA